MPSTGYQTWSTHSTSNGDIQHIHQYIAFRQKARELEISSEMINEQISLVQEALTTAIMNNPDDWIT